MKRQEGKKSTKPLGHRIMWALVVIFIVASIAVMMLADYYFAPGSGDLIRQPKDAAES